MNMRSVWGCSRNGIAANLAVFLAAGMVGHDSKPCDPGIPVGAVLGQVGGAGVSAPQ
jgi:hypothetical protein